MAVMTGNTQVVDEAYAAFGRRDIGTLLGLLHDDVDWAAPRTLPQGGAFRGRAAVAKFFEIVGDSFGPLDADIERKGEIDGETVAAVVRMHGELRTGAPTEWNATHVFTIRDGKITRFREYTLLDGRLA